MRRNRSAKIVATLGPSSSTKEQIGALAEAGVDVFRFNFSHGSHDDHAERFRVVRELEVERGRPIGTMIDLQGPKLRIGRFEGGRVTLNRGDAFRLDLDETPGSQQRARLPHPEIFAVLAPEQELLLDDGKIRLRVERCGPEFAETTVVTGGGLSDRKGVNVPNAVLPISAMTDKDRADLQFGLETGFDYVALSFVQRPEDVAEARRLIAGRAAVMSKIEKPAAIDRLDEIIELSDAIMVARGDLGVEMPPQEVPPLQKRIVESARRFGRPVVVATQMLESMITSPTPTRAEVSDVATAVYDGADAVMLSAESASGQYPCEAVTMMNSIATSVEADPGYAARVHFTRTIPDATTADAIAQAAHAMVDTVGAKAIVCFTASGSTARRISRERPAVPLLVLTPKLGTARKMGVLWGAHAVRTRDVGSFEEMIAKAKRMALRHDVAKGGDRIVIIAGVPFGTPGSTNVIHIVRLIGDELERHRATKA